MKKSLLSIAVILSFGIYVFQEHTGNLDREQISYVPPETEVIPKISEAPSTTPTKKNTSDTLKQTPLSGNGNGNKTPVTPTKQKTPVTETKPSATTEPQPKPAPSPSPTPASTGQYHDGQYTGSNVDVYYGFVQVKATVSGGKLTDVQFLDYPQDRDTSRRINNQAMPLLISEAITAQSAQVDAISGASATSEGFIQSLGDALASAKA